MEKIIRVENGVSILDAEVSRRIAEFEKQLKALKEQEDELKQLILEEMEKQGIIKLEDETSGLSINYIAKGYIENFDKKKFREDYPDKYDDYIKMSSVSPYIKINVKG